MIYDVEHATELKKLKASTIEEDIHKITTFHHLSNLKQVLDLYFGFYRLSYIVSQANPKDEEKGLGDSLQRYRIKFLVSCQKRKVDLQIIILR